jgi:hypothetical protein
VQVGLLSSHTQLVRIKNVLTEQQDTMEVPTEETLLEVRTPCCRRDSKAWQAAAGIRISVAANSSCPAHSCCLEWLVRAGSLDSTLLSLCLQVQQRYLSLNSHATSYTWKALVKTGQGTTPVQHSHAPIQHAVPFKAAPVYAKGPCNSMHGTSVISAQALHPRDKPVLTAAVLCCSVLQVPAALSTSVSST